MRDQLEDWVGTRWETKLKQVQGRWVWTFQKFVSTLELLDKLLDSEQDFRNIVWPYVKGNSIVTENVVIVILIGKRMFILTQH